MSRSRSTIAARCAAGLLTTVLCTAASMPAAVSAREVNDLETIQREARIVADVLKSSLRNELRDGARVTSVIAEYLAHQGILISIKLNAPWLVINDGDSAININGQINLEEIPTMVENILSDLQIDVSRYEPESLESLREMREEQRDLRIEQRKIRTKLRKARRDLVRADDDKKDKVQEDIEELELELQALEAQNDALTADIDRQYDELKDYRGGPSTRQQPRSSKADVNSVIAQSVCDYAATMKSLNADNYLTVAVRRNDISQYYAFKMDHVRSCNRGDMRTERLLELAYQYEG